MNGHTCYSGKFLPHHPFAVNSRNNNGYTSLAETWRCQYGSLILDLVIAVSRKHLVMVLQRELKSGTIRHTSPHGRLDQVQKLIRPFGRLDATFDNIHPTSEVAEVAINDEYVLPIPLVSVSRPARYAQDHPRNQDLKDCKNHSAADTLTRITVLPDLHFPRQPLNDHNRSLC